jgi:hypothetical protein
MESKDLFLQTMQSMFLPSCLSCRKNGIDIKQEKVIINHHILLEQIFVEVPNVSNGKMDKIVIKITITHKQVLQIITLVINLLLTTNLAKIN